MSAPMNAETNRRELLQRVALLMGGAISAPAVLGVLNGLRMRRLPDPKPNEAAEGTLLG